MSTEKVVQSEDVKVQTSPRTVLARVDLNQQQVHGALLQAVTSASDVKELLGDGDYEAFFFNNPSADPSGPDWNNDTVLRVVLTYPEGYVPPVEGGSNEWTSSSFQQAQLDSMDRAQLVEKAGELGIKAGKKGAERLRKEITAALSAG